MQELQQEHFSNHRHIYFPISSSTFSSGGGQSTLHTRRLGSKSYDGHKSQLITHLTTVAIYVQISSADLATIKRLMLMAYPASHALAENQLLQSNIQLP